MRRPTSRLRPALCLLVAIAAGLLAGCMSPPEAPRWVASPIEDFRSVSGVWEGLMIRAPQTHSSEDLVRVLIRADGTYEFASYRTIGVFHGTGTFALDNGRLTVTNEKGQVTLALYTADFNRMLKAEGVARDGMAYKAELTPVKVKERQQ